MKKTIETRGKRKVRMGKVTGDRMEKTVTVSVERKFRHPLYGKVVKKTVVFKAHDEENAARLGDVVEIMETRPLSKTKRWRLVRILKPAAGAELENSKTAELPNDQVE